MPAEPHVHFRTRGLAAAWTVAGLLTASAAQARPGGPAGANPRTGLLEPPLAALAALSGREDRAEAERLALRIGVSRLAAGLRSAEVAVARAVLDALPALPGAVRLTGPTAELLESPEPSLRVSAARTLGRLLDGATPWELDDWEVPAEVVVAACSGLRRLAARIEAPAAARLAALDAVAQSSTVCTATSELAPLLKDPVLEVRRAAALVVRPRDRVVASPLRELLADPEAQVAGAAAAALCRSADRTRAPEAAALEAARRLAAAPVTPAEDVVEMLPCLVVSGTPEDRKILDELRRRPQSPVRDRAAELAGGPDVLRP